ncbi:MAG: LacI family DNA-binding transcriptional regulator [Bacillota bacterium]|nr:LacI family DNA-binding transcriptional regulator [Bacillota bacterium]
MATISDVARKAQVSKSTVSRVLNGHSVREENRIKVMRAIKELGYSPNAQARSLTSGRTNVIGVMVPDMDGPFYGSILEGCQQTLWFHGFYMLVRSTHHEKGSEPNLVKLLWEKRVDGLIILTPREIKEKPMQEVLKELVSTNFPLVIADGDIDNVNVSGVWVDNFLGGYKATNHLLQLNHRRIAIILGPEDAPEAIRRLNGYKRALKESGVPVDENLIHVAGDYLAESVFRIFPDIMAAGPTAIFATSDELAYGVLEACKQHGINVPNDLSLIGYDDVPFAKMLTPKLTTIAQPLTALGQVAAGKIARIISGEEREIAKIILPTELVVRESTTSLKVSKEVAYSKTKM